MIVDCVVYGCVVVRYGYWLQSLGGCSFGAHERPRDSSTKTGRACQVRDDGGQVVVDGEAA